MYLDLTEERLAILDRWADWTVRESHGAVVPDSKRIVGSRRDEAIVAERELRAARMEWRQHQQKRRA